MLERRNPSRPGLLRRVSRILLPATIMAVMVASFGLGSFMESSRGDIAIAARAVEVADLRDRLSRSRQQADRLSAELEAVRAEAAGAAGDYAQLAAKTEFLNRYLSYIRDASDDQLQSFSNYVCTMWKADPRPEIGTGGVEITPSQLMNGLSPELSLALAAHGIELPELEREVAEAAQKSIDERGGIVSWDEEAAERLNDRLQVVQIAKSVTFFDGSEYVIPQYVALQLSRTQGCAPS